MSVGVIPVATMREALDGIDLHDLAGRLGVTIETVKKTLGLTGDRQRVTRETAERYLTAAERVVARERLLGIPAARCRSCRTRLFGPSPTGKCGFCQMGMVA